MPKLVMFTTKESEKLWDIWECILVPLGHVHSHLRHPHNWVWLTAAQIFGLLFASCQPEELIRKWNAKKTKKKLSEPVAVRFLTSNLEQKVRFLLNFFLPSWSVWDVRVTVLGMALRRSPSSRQLIAHVTPQECQEPEKGHHQGQGFSDNF